MTREELKRHCEKQVENCEMWAKCKGEEPHGKVYEEHKLILELLEQEPCEDVISRQIISDYVQSHIQEINTGYGDLNKHTNEILRMIVDYIENMPPVTPQKPFMNKPCVAHQVCHEDRVKVIEKIRAEIDEQYDKVHPYNLSCAEGLEMALGIIDKYKAESEVEE